MAISQEQVEKLVGMKARLWDFMPSHDHLVIRLVDKSDAEQFLVLSGCEEISAPVFWYVQAPRFASTGGKFFEFLDNRVRIVCQDSSLQSSYTRPM
jgi:hypothetical protein